MTTEDVWEFLGENTPPWGGSHTALISLYRNAGGGECPVSEEEWIVLLDVYLTHNGQALSAKHPAVIKASETLNTLGEQTGRRSGPHFRSPSGLHRQLGVFRRLDPVHRSGDGKVPQLAEEVWKRLGNDPRGCRAAADEVRGKMSR